MGIIIAGFATCGKSILGKKYNNIKDLESSPYKNIMRNDIPIEEQKGTKRELNPLWPQNYYDAINEAVKKYDVVLVQLKPEHFDYFDKHNIKYSIAYPNLNNFDEVKSRCMERNNNEDFIIRLKEVFKPYYEDSIKRDYEKLYILNDHKTLEDCLLEDNIYLEIK